MLMMIEKTRRESESRKTRGICSREALEYIGIELLNFQLEHQENIFQWK
tara:strand:+ start:3924 stop:4070 length:147 start_codon:yes stop_codon:yes gene_type:complete